MKRSKIKVRPVGSIFNWRGKQLKVVADPRRGNPCISCVFDGQNCEYMNCTSYKRGDYVNVHYEKVKD